MEKTGNEVEISREMMFKYINNDKAGTFYNIVQSALSTAEARNKSLEELLEKCNEAIKHTLPKMVDTENEYQMKLYHLHHQINQHLAESYAPRPLHL